VKIRKSGDRKVMKHIFIQRRQRSMRKDAGRSMIKTNNRQ